MVKIKAGKSFVDIKTVSRDRKSPHFFCIPRRTINNLTEGDRKIKRDLDSYAELSLFNGILNISFTWLSAGWSSEVNGYKEDIYLNYEEFSEFLRVNEGSWKCLSQKPIRRKPKLDFSNAQERLQKIVANPQLRKKIAHALGKNFDWPDAKVIYFFSDYIPYSFFFREEKLDDSPGICGGLVYHEYDGESYYSVHT